MFRIGASRGAPPPGRHHQATPPAHIKDGASRAVIISRLTLNEVYHNTLPVTMSLWRPYSDDVPVDLTRPQVQGVEFPDHHPPQCSECYPPQCSECYPPQLPVSPEHLPHGGYYAPLQISPGGSTSGYDAAPKRRLAPEPSIEAPDTLSDDLDFQDFEESALSVMAARNGGALLCSNPRMRRCVRASSADVAADDAASRGAPPPGRHHQATPPAHIKDGASRAVIISRLTLNEVYHNTLPVTMSLWRPYSDDVPVDLTRPQVQGVEFPDHHPPQCSECYPPQCSECYPPQLPVSPEHLPHGGYYAPLQISPGGSTSGYDAAPKRRLAPEPSIEAPDTLSDDLDFQDFEESALSVMAARNGGALLCSNPRMRRCVRASSADVAADDAYLQKRDRNNLAAKRSRDRRKLREIHLTLKASYLKKQVAALRARLKTGLCAQCNKTYV
ncbi:hypothetical protein PYW08_011475 [Mythimna loreyi]|uniref:Uncharacterized protein n=1 Tax=Mythimna loreyi TaxID=667449 RepID=A0ACC2QM14_9NEOP|nr:hypothetical protein PYW08_011475 [Mythimna loreyi]